MVVSNALAILVISKKLRCWFRVSTSVSSRNRAATLRYTCTFLSLTFLCARASESKLSTGAFLCSSCGHMKWYSYVPLFSCWFRRCRARARHTCAYAYMCVRAACASLSECTVSTVSTNEASGPCECVSSFRLFLLF